MGVKRPAGSAIICYLFCEFYAVSYSGSYAEQVTDFVQGMVVFVYPFKLDSDKNQGLRPVLLDSEFEQFSPIYTKKALLKVSQN